MDLYKYLRNTNGEAINLPFINLQTNDSDRYEKYSRTKTESRLDVLSYKYYGDSKYRFLILLGNPNYMEEHEIEEGAIIRIPFPKDIYLDFIESQVRQYGQLNL